MTPARATMSTTRGPAGFDMSSLLLHAAGAGFDLCRPASPRGDLPRRLGRPGKLGLARTAQDVQQPVVALVTRVLEHRSPTSLHRQRDRKSLRERRRVVDRVFVEQRVGGDAP